MLSTGRLPRVRRPALAVRLLLVLAFGLLVLPGVSACSASHPAAAWTAAPAAPNGPMSGSRAPSMGGSMTAAMTAAWAARPEYVRADSQTEEAYAYAAATPQVLQWIPCYCGCGAMGHRSNLDCYFKPTMAGLTDIRFEEHASGCRICVDITLMVKRMAGEGQSLRAIRDAVDQSFGGRAPGTPTELPPA